MVLEDKIDTYLLFHIRGKYIFNNTRVMNIRSYVVLLSAGRSGDKTIKHMHGVF